MHCRCTIFILHIFGAVKILWDSHPPILGPPDDTGGAPIALLWDPHSCVQELPPTPISVLGAPPMCAGTPTRRHGTPM